MKWKCEKCKKYMHDQENSFYVWDYDRALHIEWDWVFIIEKLGLADKIDYKNYELKSEITQKDIKKIIKSLSKKELLGIILGLLQDLYEAKKPSGEVWRCPVCDNLQFEDKDWPYQGVIFDFDGFWKKLGIDGKDELEWE